MKRLGKGSRQSNQLKAKMASLEQSELVFVVHRNLPIHFVGIHLLPSSFVRHTPRRISGFTRHSPPDEGASPISDVHGTCGGGFHLVSSETWSKRGPPMGNHEQVATEGMPTSNLQ